MIAKKLVALFLSGLFISSFLGVAPSVAATPKVGGSCTKTGIKSGLLICTKVNGKLIWQISKKSQSISYSAPSQISVSEKSVKFTFASSSGLAVKATSITKKICSLATGEILLVGTLGKCQITLTQSGNNSFTPAPSKTVEISVMGINEIDFQLPGALLLTQGSSELTATSSSGGAVVFTSVTPEVCLVNEATLTLLKLGKCTVSANQIGGGFFAAAVQVVRSVEISGSRVTGDLPDTFSGFQVKAIYVVPSDGEDNSLDTNGTIAQVLDDGTAFLKSQLNLTIPIDKNTTGYDIAFLKSSMPSSYFLNNTGAYAELLEESKLLNSPGLNRKDYIFFVQTDTVISPGYCGEAPTPGITAIVAIGVNECGKQTAFFKNYASQTWVHELFHNLGVEHVPEPCDLMTSGVGADGSTCPPNQSFTIDSKRDMYFGASKFGQDISQLRVWDGYTNDQTLQADCIVSAINGKPLDDGLRYAYCPTGTQIIGPVQYCWSFINADSLEELVNGAWVSLGAASSSTNPWGSRVDWKCAAESVAPTKEITVTGAGVRHYRWVIDGVVREEFKIIWVN